jgi:signal peptidase II
MTLVASGSSRARSAAFARTGIVLAIVLALDQVTKHTLATGIALGQERHFVPGVKFVHVRNKGVAFGFLSSGGVLVLTFTFIALGVLVAYLWLRPQRRWLWLPTGLLLGGALGNLIDRIGRGSVIDFIKLPHWPAFNVADMAITFGVLSLLLVIELGARDGG